MAVKKWRSYLIVSTFFIRIDHHSLKNLLKQKVGTPIQHKLISKLRGYEFLIEFRSGHSNRVVDALSRCGFETNDALLDFILFPTPIWFP